MDDASLESRVGTIVQAMAVRDGKVLATGSNAEIQALAGPSTKSIDLKGRAVLPGFILTHDHPTDWAWQDPRPLNHVLPNDDVVVHRWLPNVPPKEQLAKFDQTIREALSKAKPGQWVFVSFNWGPDYKWSREMAPLFQKSITKEYIDQLAPDNPVKVKDGLVTSIVNQKAIDELRSVHPTLNVIANTPQRVEAWLKKGGGFSRPIEPAAMMKGKLPVLAEILKAEMELYPMYGAVAVASSAYASQNLQALDYLDKKGEMPMRFGWGYPGPDWSTDALQYLAGMMGHGTDHLWLAGMFAATGANCMTVPPRGNAQETAVGETLPNCSLAPGTPSRKILDAVIQSGLRVATIHTGGDKDIDYYMDAIEQGSQQAGLTQEQIRARRHAFDHSGGAPRPDQILRMKKLGMMASLNNFLLWKQDGILGMMSTSWIAKNYGTEYTAWVSPRNSMIKAGVINSWEIDRPMHNKLFFFITKGMNRFNDEDQQVYAPGERTDRIIQLKAITRWGASYLLRENVMGSLEPSKFADFIVLDKDYLTISEDQIPSIQILMTAVGGKIVHLNPALAREVGMQPVGPTTWKEKTPEGWEWVW